MNDKDILTFKMTGVYNVCVFLSVQVVQPDWRNVVLIYNISVYLLTKYFIMHKAIDSG